MVRYKGIALAVAAALVGGCLPNEFLQPDGNGDTTPLVPASQFASPPPTKSPVFSQKPPPSTPGVAIKVDEVGQKLVSANPKLGMKPLFLTVGSSAPEMFHRDTSALYITEGLVRGCKNDAQLAALLSVELGRMVAQREAMALPEARAEKSAPLAIQMGNTGQFNGLDQLQLVEQTRMDAERKRPTKRNVPADPLVLAASYLENAGYDPRDLDVVAPLLQQADKTFVIEKQFKGQSGNLEWVPK